MKKIVWLGTLSKGRVFYYNGRRYKVSANLGSAGVSIRSMTKKIVEIAGKTIKKSDNKTEVWSAGCDVEINTQETKEETDDVDQELCDA